MSDDKVFLIDGGLSTELYDLGYDLKDSKLWTGKTLVNDPDILKQVHKNFLQAGCEIISTASYQLSIDLIKTELNCSEDEAKSIIRKSVIIARESKEETNSKNALIAGSIGPYGACLCDGSEFKGHYVNDLSIEFLIEWHRPRLECLLEEKCDLIALETIPSIKEATALLKLLSEYPSIKAWLSFSCKDETNLCIGDSFRDAYNMFKNNDQLLAIGINCTDPYFIKGLLDTVVKNNDYQKPFIVYPNDGKIWDASIRKYVSRSFDKDPMKIVYDSLPEWIKMGAKYVGGCCNITSKDLIKFKDIINKL